MENKKKLMLKKEVISKLERSSMSNLKGGTNRSECICDTDPFICYTINAYCVTTNTCPTANACPTDNTCPGATCPTGGGADTCTPNICAGGNTDYEHCWTVPSKGYCW